MSNWARFTDPTPGQEDVAGNCLQGPMSLPPWGNAYRAEKLWRAEDWRNDLPDNWTPPETTQAKVAAAMRPYQVDLAGLLKAKAMAESLGNSTATITARYAAVMAEMKAAIQEATGMSE